MLRLGGKHLLLELVGLWLLELTLSFWLAYGLLGAGFAGELRPAVVNHAIILALTGLATAFAVGLYRPEVFRHTRSMLATTALGGLAAFPAVWAVSWLLGLDVGLLAWADPLWPVTALAAWVAALFSLRLLFLAAVRSNVFVRRVGTISPLSSVARTSAAVRAGHRGFIEIADARGPDGRLPAPKALREMGTRTLLAAAPDLAAFGPDQRTAYSSAGIAIESEAQFWERALKRVDVANLDAAWVASLDAAKPGRLQSAVNRALDVVTSLALVVFTAPLMLLVALLIRLDSPGPVLYRQERVGLGGIPFTLLKFRSMKVDAEARGPAWAKQRDPRVTRIGSFMRRTRIDELPQLLNILRGQMSFIGPRPERPHFVEQLAEAIPFYRERARVKPGLTGWAQVCFPYGASIEDARDKLSYDLYYVKHRSQLLDLRILFATVRVILFQEGSR